MNLFEQASRVKLRFDTVQGPLDVESLWDLPVNTQVKNKASLADIVRGLNKQLKDIGDDLPFLNAARKTDDTVQLRFDIVKHIIETKTADADKAAQARTSAETKQKLMSIIAIKESEELSGKSLEDLRKLVAAM